MTESAEWGLRFQELAAEAGQLSVRSLRRYQELLDRVAAGDLQTEWIQNQFRDYLQAQATSSTQTFVELSVGLLAGLLYIEAKYRETLLAGLLPPDGPIPAPPKSSSADLLNWFQALSTYATEQSARGLARHQLLVDRVAKGEIQPDQVKEQGRRFLEQHSPAFLSEVVNLGLSFVGDLQKSSSSFTEGLYDRVLGPDNTRKPVPEPPIYVDLRGPSGSVVSASLVVENTRRESADVVCSTSEFVARAFGRRFRAPLEIDPQQFVLTPGEQREINLRLPLDPSLFSPGADYVATLQISGANERELIVHLLVNAESRSAADSPAATSNESATALETMDIDGNSERPRPTQSGA